MSSKRKQDAGFTLMELMIVMLIIGILMMVAIPRFEASVKQAREAVLKEDLHVMRAAIDSYTMDKQKAPNSLDDLTQDGYLREIPIDPFTHTKDSWVTDTSSDLYSLDQTGPGHLATFTPVRRRPAPTAPPTPPGKREDYDGCSHRGKNDARRTLRLLALLLCMAAFCASCALAQTT